MLITNKLSHLEDEMNTSQNIDIKIKPVVLFDELCAYEAPWDEEGTTFKRIADQFRSHQVTDLKSGLKNLVLEKRGER